MMTKPKYEWCQTEEKCIDFLGFAKPFKRGRKVKKYIRCPNCKKRIQCYIRECDDPGCLHLWMPKHKKRIN